MSSGVLNLSTAGGDFGGTLPDSLVLFYQVLNDDGVLTVRTTTAAGGWGGAMLREGLAGNSKMAFLAIDSDGSGGFVAEGEYRLTTGGFPGGVGFATAAIPYWERIVRQGSTVSQYVSSDGVNWASVASLSRAEQK
jgi:hypothetical protein